jgi:anti-sigma B factor antagonist
MVLTLETRKCEPGVLVIELGGRITLGPERGQIQTAVTKALNEGIKRLVFDLTHVAYIDSSGIGIIAYCFGKITQQGGNAAVVGAGGLVKEVFKLTRLDNVIPFFPDVASACDGLAAARPPA